MQNPLSTDAILEDRLAIVGTTGSGKTYAAGTAVERILGAGHRTIIIDPLGAWWGLRLGTDGKTPSRFNVVIFGGRHGDIDLTEGSGQIIGETVAGMQQSCIVDLSKFGTAASERRFMLAFLAALYRSTENNPVHIIFDEADMWAPQVLLDRDGDPARLLGMMETIVRRGRIKGFVPWLITQRPASLSKNVLSQADGLVALKLTSSQDRDAIGAWVEGQADKAKWKELYASLATMKRGEGIVWIPARQVMKTATFPAKITYDSSRTPKRGETVQAVALTPVDIAALQKRLATVEAETKANDPKALKAEVARLSAELKKTAAAGPTSAEIGAAKAEAYAEGWSKGYTDGRADGLSSVSATLSEIEGVIATHRRRAPAQQPRPAAPTPPPSAPPPPRSTPTVARAAPAGATSLSPSAKAILEAVHRSYPMGLSFDAAARRAGISKKSSAYRKYRDEVLSSGEVSGEASRLQSLPGYGASQPVEPGASVETWVARLTPSCGKMLRAIAEGYDTKPDIADRAGISQTSSGLGAGLRELIELELITETDGLYRLSDGM